MSLTSSPISSERADLTDSRLAALCAETVQRAFLEYEERFRAITLRARERFLARDWQGSYADAGGTAASLCATDGEAHGAD